MPAQTLRRWLIMVRASAAGRIAATKSGTMLASCLRFVASNQLPLVRGPCTSGRRPKPPDFLLLGPAAIDGRLKRRRPLGLRPQIDDALSIGAGDQEMGSVHALLV